MLAPLPRGKGLWGERVNNVIIRYMIYIPNPNRLLYALRGPEGVIFPFAIASLEKGTATNL